MSIEDPTALDDVVMHDRIKQIVDEQNIQVIVETGVYHGMSTAKLAEMVPLVYAVENDARNVLTSFTNIYNHTRCRNVAMICGNSPDVLNLLRIFLPDNTLYLLDAHWQSYWPLLDEIAAIRRKSGVIVIHDFKVPDHPELGYDTYNGQDLDYEYVKNALTEWSPSHWIEYNERSEGTPLPRGVGYIFPR